jgi:predicted RND superfamily exporter protein
MEDGSDARGYRFFEWVNRRIGRIASVAVVLAVVLGIVGPMVANDEDANFSPTGEIYDIQERVGDLFTPESAIAGATFLVEDPAAAEGVDADVLTAESMLLWKQRADALRTSTKDVLGRPLNARLVTGVDPQLGIEIDKIFSIVDVVDPQLPGGLENATDRDVKQVLAGLFADGAPTAGLRATLADAALEPPAPVGGFPVWRAPAFTAELRYDVDSFDGATIEERFVAAEAWLIEAQTVLRGGQRRLAPGDPLNVWGIAIDFDTAFSQSFQEGGPFVFYAVALIVLLVGALLRSYWAAAAAALGLGVTMLTYNGVVGLIQLDVSPLLQLIVPIAMISFGVDFFIHGAGRVREAQVEGVPRMRAYPIGATAVFTALLLAVVTSAAAFLSNSVPGLATIEAISEFGIGAAVALLLAYVFLGLLAPRVLIGIEERLGPRPTFRGLTVTVPFRAAFYKVLFFLASVFAGVMVAMTVVFPLVGAAIFLVYLLLAVYLPLRWTARRNRRAAASGEREMTEQIRGAGHGFRAAGSVVHFLARWRVVTLPAVGIIAVVGVVAAFQVEKAFELVDLLPSDTDTVQSINKSDEYFSRAGGPGYILVEGDLTEPATLDALDAALQRLQASDAPFRTDLDGSVAVSPSAVSIARAAVASAPALALVTSETGVTVTDADGDGMPDDAAQVRAVYATAVSAGIPDAAGNLILRPDVVQRFLWVDGDVQATRLEVEIVTFTDEPLIVAAQQELNAIAADLEAGIEAAVGVSGPPLTNKDTLDGFVDSMLVSLPVAVILATLIAWFVMRSLRYALASIVPILLVVAWIYAYMVFADIAINPVTATIAAIAIGVGIDFATHFTVRFREEFAGEPSRFPALRRAGEGTGGALALSALTSVIGFWVLSFAPTPIFATFGQLTAVMIVFALAVSLLVLPSLLLLVTPSRRGEERELLEQAVTQGEFVYEPHARSMAQRQSPPEE